ncbi:MAG: hypothetical protein AB1422_01350 [bacterium]
MKIHRIVKLLNRRDISKVDKELRRQIAIKINGNRSGGNLPQRRRGTEKKSDNRKDYWCSH